MLPTTMRLLHIKPGTGAREHSRGTGPRPTMKKRTAYRRAWACPSPSFRHADVRGGQAPALRSPHLANRVKSDNQANLIVLTGVTV